MLPPGLGLANCLLLRQVSGVRCRGGKRAGMTQTRADAGDLGNALRAKEAPHPPAYDRLAALEYSRTLASNIHRFALPNAGRLNAFRAARPGGHAISWNNGGTEQLPPVAHPRYSVVEIVRDAGLQDCAISLPRAGCKAGFAFSLNRSRRTSAGLPFLTRQPSIWRSNVIRPQGGARQSIAVRALLVARYGVNKPAEDPLYALAPPKSDSLESASSQRVG